ncbi:MAG: hypothetical protein LW847_14940 [Burkholderiales bacterium]|jgi:MFS family permease|nr:hypothetical protein [Burkholderiales bacterium]
MQAERKRKHEPAPPKRAAIVGAAGGALGGLIGYVFAPYIVATLPQQPAWAIPAIVVASVGVFLLAGLLLPLVLRKRHGN